MLSEGLDTGMDVMSSSDSSERGLKARVVRGAIVIGDERSVSLTSGVVAPIEVIERRESQHKPRSGGVNPRKIHKRVALPVEVADTEQFLRGRIRDLIVVPSKRADQSQLVGGRGVEDQGREPAQTAVLVVQHARVRRHQAGVGAVTVTPPVVRN